MLLHHLRAHFGDRIVVPRPKIRVLAENKFINLVCDQVKVDKQRIHYWYKDTYVVVLQEIEMLGFERKKYDVNYFIDKKVDLIIGKDKGQEKFRVLFKLLIRLKDDNKVLFSLVKKVGYIDCDKDNYQMLKQTVAPSIDTRLAILATQKLCFTKVKVFFSLDSSGTNILFCFKIKFIGTGDLDFYHIILGRVNMSSS